MTEAVGRGGAARRAPAFSFEFFPPKNDAQVEALDETVTRLTQLRPHFVSVTYGAGGSAQERSFGAVERLQRTGLNVAAHLTCAGASRETVRAAIGAFRSIGIDRFVALRGDPPGGLGQPYRPHPSGFTDTADLVAALNRQGAMEVSVSAYPERHPHSPDWLTEIATLKRKADAGARRAITQFFFENDLFEAYVERVRRAGIWIPIVPGIMPIHRFAQIAGFAKGCGASIPADLARRFDGLEPDADAYTRIAAETASEQVADLMRRGVDAFHIYTLNRAELTEAICRSCGVIPNGARAAA
jgi:methylenetetrahydrofolate reductase (NADPH)